MDFSGDRSKQAIIGWVEKKILPATSDVDSQQALDKLQESDSVSLVLYSDNQDDISKFTSLAAGDDYNKYFIATGDLASKYSETTVEVIRNFGKTETFNGVGDGFEAWAQKHSRPLVLDFDDRAIKDIFQKQKNAIVLFNKENQNRLVEILREVANSHSGETLFVEITADNEHYNRFAQFIKLDVETPRLIALASKKQKKAIFSESLEGVTVDQVRAFAQSIEDETATFLGLQDPEPKSADAATEAKTDEPV